MIKTMEKIYLVSPLYLGDAFVINALVRDWAMQAQEVHLPTLPQYVHTVQSLYSDCENVHVVPYLGEQLENEHIKKLNCHVINFRTIYETHQLCLKHVPHVTQVPVNWDRQIYEYFDVPFSKRYTNFKLPSHVPHTQELFDQLNPKHEPYVLWHGMSHTLTQQPQIDLISWRRSIGAPDRLIIPIQTGVTANLLSYLKLIEHAEEIHCIPSAFHCLVDSVTGLTKANLFFHDVKAHTIMQVNSRWNSWRWNSVFYEHKIS